eukprot:TRINITY_DN47917_c0_g1_i1.p1 TRINITY_DN47917_c0_g1~~TRINITY_DN47917_c0_g1_i1.p1  ORF type:complete len:507 (+),score=111.94 TRINITY_DN47917_c0_g1_i1:191-1522(+)
MVIWRDHVLHLDAHGFADVERRIPMRTDTIVRLYCMSKSVVAAGIMILVEQGKCALDDDVARYIPSFSDVRVAARADATGASPADARPASLPTLRHLLTHTAGLGYGKEFHLPPECPAEESYQPLIDAVEQGDVVSLEDFCDRLAALPLRRAPGTAFEYSYGLDVIGRVIEVVSGMALDAFLEEHLFRPLGMVDTGFAVPASKLDRLAVLYGSRDTAQHLGMDAEPPPGAKPWALMQLDGNTSAASAWAEGRSCRVLSGGGFMGYNRGGLVSTLNDMARFCLAISRGGALPGGARVLREETVRDMVGQDWLRMPQCLGCPQTNKGLPGVTATSLFGWNALGELGVNTQEEAPNAYEPQEYGYGGIAETFWSINPARELITLWFTQQVDNHSWTSPQANLWAAARKAVAGVPTRRTVATESQAARSRSPRRRLSRKTKVTPEGA